MHEGHRKRILERARDDSAGLQDHELLEILLFNCIPRKNTNPIAHELIDAFGSLDGVLSARFEQLLAVNGIGESTASYLCCISEINRRVNNSSPTHIKHYAEFKDNLLERLRKEQEEVLLIYCLDANKKIIHMRRFSSGQATSVKVSAGAVSQTISICSPKSVILAHNHPVGSAKPSDADEEFTRQVSVICSLNGVLLYDHIIVGPHDEYSYYLHGRMEALRDTYQLDKLISEQKKHSEGKP